MTTPSENPTHPWLQQPEESDRDYARFERYLLMGPVQRSVNAAWIAEQTEAGKPIPDRVNAPGKLYERARQWDWESRAAAWDAHQRELAAESLVESDRLVQEAALLGTRLLLELLQNTENEWLRWQVASFLIREGHRAASRSTSGPLGSVPVRTITVIDPSENMEPDLSNWTWSEEAGAMVKA